MTTSRRLLLVTLLSVLSAFLTPLNQAGAAPRALYVATWGDNGNPGTEAAPFRTIRWGVTQARPGETVFVRGGTYVESAGGTATPATSTSPITLRNYPGENVLVKGTLRMTDADWWTVDGINVTRDPNRAASSLVAFNGGSNWTLRNSEIWGTHGTSNLIIQPSAKGPAQNFLVTDNCIHHAAPTGERQGTEHNIYLFPGLDGTGGLITRNVLFDAPNGANIKVGGPGDGRGPANVKIRFNTMASAISGVIVYRDADANLIERNLFTNHVNGDATYNGAVISILADGKTNLVRDNAWHAHPYGHRDHGSVGDAFRVVNHLHVSTTFDSIASCRGLRPTDATAQLYGRWAKDAPLPGGPFFTDISGSTFEADIRWLAAAGITAGCNPPTNDRFCPDATVTRGQMAAFLVRALDLPPSSTDRFKDDNGSIFEKDIQALAAAGITAGCNPPTNDRFCPDATVTRGQMAAFLVRALDLPPSSTDRFKDDNGSIFEKDIQALAAAGITAGCNPPTNDRFCPDATVTRGQMAAFLRRALG